MLLVCALIELILAIVSSAFCCSAVCCGASVTPHWIPVTKHFSFVTSHVENGLLTLK